VVPAERVRQWWVNLVNRSGLPRAKRIRHASVIGELPDSSDAGYTPPSLSLVMTGRRATADLAGRAGGLR
jgi:hypothetical protein